MRPTDLHFRNPHQKTPDFYDALVTVDGKKLMFRSKSQNKKRTFSSQPRFQQYQDWHKVTGVMLGPGAYNDGEKFQILKAQPCQSIYKQHHMGKDAGKACYIMCGNNITYEPSFVQAKTQKQMSSLSIDLKCKVSSHTFINKQFQTSTKRTQSALSLAKQHNHSAFIKRSQIEDDDAFRTPQGQYTQLEDEIDAPRPMTSHQIIRPLSSTMQERPETQGGRQLVSIQQQPYGNKDDFSAKNSSINARLSNSTKTNSTYMNNSPIKSQYQKDQMNLSFDYNKSLTQPSAIAEQLKSQQMFEKQHAYNNILAARPNRQLVKGTTKPQPATIYAKTATSFYNMNRSGGSRAFGRKYSTKGAKNITLKKSLNLISAYGQGNDFARYHNQQRGNYTVDHGQRDRADDVAFIEQFSKQKE